MSKKEDALAHRAKMMNTPAADARDERTANHCISLDYIYLLCAENDLSEATIAAQSEKIDLALIIIGEGKKNMCGGKLCMSYLKDIKEALEGMA